MIESVVKTLYLNADIKRDPRTGRIEKSRPDALFYVVADSNGGRNIHIKNEPEYVFFKAKEDLGYHRLSCPVDMLEPVKVKYSVRHNEMAKVLGIIDEYRQAKEDWRTKSDFVNKRIYGSSQLYHADMHVEDVFKLNFNEKHGDHSADISYRPSFMDIEVRADLDDFDQHKALVPICSICHLDSATKTIYVNVLNDKDVPEIVELFGNLQDFVKEMREFFTKIMLEAIESIVEDGGKASNIDDFKYKFQFRLVETEADLIETYANVLKETKPDFCGCWGINFDMITISKRAAKNGLNMADLFSDPSVPPEYRYFQYVEDPDRFNRKAATHFSRYMDKIFSTSPTQFYCQMSLHSNLRKRFLEDNYKLNTIGEKYAYIKKYDLESEGYTIKDVYKKNFRVFLKYAIMDVVVQDQIERANKDIPRYMVSCKDSRFTHGTRKTVGIKNELATFLKERGEIIGNNKGYDIDESVPGAIIASPNLIIKKGINLMGILTHIYRSCVDFDLTAEYPSLMIAYNILKTTIFGRIVDIFFERDIGNGNTLNIPISQGGDFNKMMETLDTSIFDIGQKYFGLPSVDQVLSHIENGCINTKETV